MKTIPTMGLAAVLTATTAMTAIAETRTITVPTPKSITIVCSDTVKPGTVVMTNPPKFACSDYEMASAIIGTGITLHQNSKAREVVAAIKRHKAQEKYVVSKAPTTRGTNDWDETWTNKETGSTIKWKNGPGWNSIRDGRTFLNSSSDFRDDFEDPNSRISDLLRRKHGHVGTNCSGTDVIRGNC